MGLQNLYIVIACLLCSCNANITEEDLIADAGPLGKIIGRNLTSVGGNPVRAFVAFRGIRYANSTTGAGRFKPSVRFNGPLNATGDTYLAAAAGYPCPNPGTFEQLYTEDCLTINVYTPKPYRGNDSDLLPVLFYIHGGAFTVGDGNTYNGNRLMNRDIVHVTFNYRLGLLGFFSLSREDVPGNAGMYDIINALDWTRDYIKSFGGDPNRITIAGQSAGSAAVTHLMASPMAQGKFQGAIAASGSALSAWATTDNPLPGSLAVSELAGCYNSSDGPPDDAMFTTIANCMRTVRAPALVSALFTYQVTERTAGRLGFGAVSPVVQSFSASGTFVKFLPEHPRVVFEEGRQADVPLLMGATRHDGSYVLGIYYNRFLTTGGRLNNTEYMSQEAVPHILKQLGIPNEFGVYDSIAKMYLGDARKTGLFELMYPGFIDLFSVFFFKAPAYQTAMYQAKKNNNTYWYSFDYRGPQTMWRILFTGMPVPPFSGGIAHGDDLIYLFTLTSPPNLNEEETIVSNRMMDYWANFVTSGNPTPATSSNETHWSHLTASEGKFMSIGVVAEELQHYDDTWAGVGMEVVPEPEPPTTPEPTTPETTTLEPTTSETTPTSERTTSETTPTSERTTSETTTQTTTTTTQAGVGVVIPKSFLVLMLLVNLIYFVM